MTSTTDTGGINQTAFAGGRGPLLGTELNNVMLSQRHHVILYPQDSSVVEMSLPFIWNQDWFDYDMSEDTLGSRWNGLGTIDILSLTPMQTVGTNTTPVDLTIYAIMENIELDGPCYVAQGSDEYQEKPVSTAATAVADAAGAISNVAPPVLKPFAVATEVGARMVAAVAKSFGYTAPSVISNTSPVIHRGMANCANTFISDPYDCLALDPKHALSISDVDVGGSGKDELAIDTFCGKPAIWHSFPWTQASVLASPLDAFYVTPEIYVSTLKTFKTAGNYAALAFPPCGYAAMLFGKWRCTMVYKIKVLASKFHQGRLEIIYDPNGNSLRNTHLQRTFVLDLAHSNEVTIRVPYMASTQFLKTRLGSETSANPLSIYANNGNPVETAGVPYDKAVFNGQVRIRVMDQLSAPADLKDCTCLVWAWAEDITFAEPKAPDSNFGFDYPYTSHLDPYILQSLEEPIVESSDDFGGNAAPQCPTVAGGEVIKSLRALFGRMVFNDTRRYYCTTAQTGILRISKLMPRFPLPPGGFTNLVPTTGGATVIVTPVDGSVGYNYTRFSAVTWLTPCFVGWRGSMKHRVRVSGGTYAPLDGLLRIGRSKDPFNAGASAVNEVSSVYTNALSNSRDSYYASTVFQDDMLGAAMGCTTTEPVLSVRAPMYSQYSMHPANPALWAMSASTAAAFKTDLIFDNIKVAVEAPVYTDNTRMYQLTTHIAAGEDFTPLIFVNTPIVYRYFAGAAGAGQPTSLNVITT